ncbi:MAG: hypothetical protein A3C50_00345 [Candidatus Staskawiczbacteria bacterium RIFCSPHIGHO2_02_FULL_43_16]|uniref:HEPN domain-containing protein n=1 Tax=Candidatus Staskawiczbacteria bacterium RIFCSPHIGHO2_01_FULL_41_41 TaxID=1802203 RepID=A0A1G2HVT1_9BACT|nr:MAG: hypothetical protein A2822_02010 [Candidatus Staskawiczbacteria bacterium RIFCSPHIGHO2_01_FULL_41_41]OGZ68963.1 MAG: hypothetical protein A3C50_00345 [Candidatus Staskawiczbacteria bacterium RIFCSPHIGHO2_02_FULL_43_16]OGZ75047.1 MAG: hypothetical protein A3A12_03470 [Candidatus Staskawiczbacteria bacterium RIFCSPLOWO2_01_FULL_43_17b]
MDTLPLIQYWEKSSKNDFAVAQYLFKSKKYSYALFFCHLSLEKLLKSFIVKHSKKSAPLEHNLVRLANKAGFTLSGEQKDLLSEITTFNIKARYDDYKTNFYKKATRVYAQSYITETKNLITWLKKNYPHIS